MSANLSYSNKTTHAGDSDWVATKPYGDDDILAIKDPDGGLSRNPRTAIPSPFAQLDLVKNAFAALANPQLRGAAMNQRLVSNALDVAQLFFDFENHKDYLRIVRWQRDEQLQQLKAEPRHRLYGETLELFLRADTAYNFDQLADWFILLYGNRVLGGTSPASVFMATPAATQIDDIMVEQGIALFSTDRPLWQRDEDFVAYLYLLMNAYPTLRERAPMVYSYMLANAAFIQRQRPDLYRRITEVVPNLSALNREAAASVMDRLEFSYDHFTGEGDVNVLGARLYHRRVTDIRTAASQSDFVIVPTVDQPDGTELPLVLRSEFNGSVDHYRYIDKEWDSATEVLGGGIALDQRKLPDTSIQYPFLTTSDLLADTLVRLSNPIDSDHYFDGCLRQRGAQRGYLLPLKQEFFRWFSAADLFTQLGGRPFFEMEENADESVTVTLRVPVKKRYIELSRRYNPTKDHGWVFDERRGTGRLVDAVMTLAVSPFVRTGKTDDYTVELFTMLAGGGGVELRFLGGTDGEPNAVAKRRSATVYTTSYYDVAGTWDYIEATLHHELGTFTGLIVPRWKPFRPSARELVFAVDFGTTNTHLEWAEVGQTSQPLTFEWSEGPVLVAPLLRRGGLDIAEQLQRIEFLPDTIDSFYGFPLRTALCRNADSDGGNKLFHDVNIPFLYERKSFGGDYTVATGLKWMGDTTLAREFLRELVLLVKAKALLEGVDPARVHVVYFFPVSMGGNDRRKLADAWAELYRTYLGGDEATRLHAYPESIAPAFYYKDSSVNGSSYVSVDIGGGTCDTVVYQPTPDRMQSRPVAISSFRFAGNALFGDAFGDEDADTNPLLQHYTRYFLTMIEQDRTTEIGYLSSILQNIMHGKRSEDINAFLFAIENAEELRGLREIDRNLYSYNALLRNDTQRKLVFVYFYAAIIYYIARAMHARGFLLPKQLYFSGTGSKILNIVGSLQQVSELSRRIFEGVYGQPCPDTFTLRIETACPKQITCRGGIRLENQHLEGRVAVAEFTPRNVAAMKYCYSMVGDKPLTLDDLGKPECRDAIVAEVRKFHRFLLELCDKDFKDEMGIDNTVFRVFTDVLERDLDNYLTAGVNAFLAGRYAPADPIEDVPFFYPIIGTIRHNLLRNLCNDVIARYRTDNH